MDFLASYSDSWVPEPNTGCYLWTAAANIGGYGVVSPRGRKNRLVSRIVCEEVYGPPPTSKHQALHNTPNGCVGGPCVNGGHLRWGTARDNALDVPVEQRQERTKRGHAIKLARGTASNMRKERWAALMAGEETYVSGKPCKRGHVSPRRSKNMHCIECEKIDNASRYGR
jgi:hypothetical protein